ncbi:hypothetical protein HHL16_03770 [Pseudoflavitalea sp. G-6-1-2]|uniref:hypothetical protein n=1 Tax=Pseudoflavitalea sp. G-6-1-2 TaxID=2728841 RepID=UPI00146C9269|nr:hypothetical protein [Pseudoflavitalea sp. G-6-1-2]NML19975.1 hypothetical protein [Pseudoflavitalea sp. G-6-1-2]
MKKFLFLIVLNFLVCGLVQAQNQIKPFKLLIVQPDTMLVHPTLAKDIDSIRAEYIRTYQASIREMEATLLTLKDSTNADERDLKAIILTELAKSKKGGLAAWRVANLIAEYSEGVYSFQFNEEEPYSTFQIIPPFTIDKASIMQLATKEKANYVLYFSNIRTYYKEGVPAMFMTSNLYSVSEKGLILQEDRESDALNKGDMFACNEKYPLKCLLLNSVKLSVEAVLPAIAKRQLKKKAGDEQGQ